MEELNTLAGQVLAGPAHLNPPALRSKAKAQIFPFLSSPPFGVKRGSRGNGGS